MEDGAATADALYLLINYLPLFLSQVRDDVNTPINVLYANYSLSLSVLHSTSVCSKKRNGPTTQYRPHSHFIPCIPPPPPSPPVHLRTPSRFSPSPRPCRTISQTTRLSRSPCRGCPLPSVRSACGRSTSLCSGEYDRLQSLGRSA